MLPQERAEPRPRCSRPRIAHNRPSIPYAADPRDGRSGDVPCRDAVVDNEPFEGVHTGVSPIFVNAGPTGRGSGGGLTSEPRQLPKWPFVDSSSVTRSDFCSDTGQ